MNPIHTNPMHKSTTDEVSSQPTPPQPDAATKAADPYRHAIHALQDMTRVWIEADEEEAAIALLRRHLPDQSAELAQARSERDENATWAQHYLQEVNALRASLAAATKERDSKELYWLARFNEANATLTKVCAGLGAAEKERDALAASFGKCQSELHALRTDNDTLAVENEKLRRILLRYLSSFDFAGGIATPINQLETLKVLLENEHLHPKA